MADGFQTSPKDITSYLHKLCAEMASILREYHTTLDRHVLLLAAQSWIIDESNRTSTSPKAVVQRVPVQDAALSLAASLLSDIAEERPGTYPFDHKPNIPVPIETIMRTIHALSVVISIFAEDNRGSRIPALTSTIGSLARIVGSDHPVDEPATLNHEGDISSAIYLVPQPGLAYCARVIEGIVQDLKQGFLDMVIDEMQDESLDALITNLGSDAVALRNLNAQYGQTPNSPE
jgi:hypothetical protein